MALGDPGVDMNAMAMHPMKGRMASQKEIVKDIRELYEKQTRDLQLTEKMLNQAIAGAEQRAGKGD